MKQEAKSKSPEGLMRFLWRLMFIFFILLSLHYRQEAQDVLEYAQKTTLAKAKVEAKAKRDLHELAQRNAHLFQKVKNLQARDALNNTVISRWQKIAEDLSNTLAKYKKMVEDLSDGRIQRKSSEGPTKLSLQLELKKAQVQIEQMNVHIAKLKKELFDIKAQKEKAIRQNEVNRAVLENKLILEHAYREKNKMMYEAMVKVHEAHMRAVCEKLEEIKDNIPDAKLKALDSLIEIVKEQLPGAKEAK